MTDQPETPSLQPAAAGDVRAGEGSATQRRWPAVPTQSSLSTLQDRAAAVADERPEIAAGAAFTGGFLLAMILKRLGD